MPLRPRPEPVTSGSLSPPSRTPSSTPWPASILVQTPAERRTGRLVDAQFPAPRCLHRWQSRTPRKGRTEMGKIVVSENVSLDGVIEDPAGVEGFRHGGWVGRI